MIRMSGADKDKLNHKLALWEEEVEMRGEETELTQEDVQDLKNRIAGLDVLIKEADRFLDHILAM